MSGQEVCFSRRNRKAAGDRSRRFSSVEVGDLTLLLPDDCLLVSLIPDQKIPRLEKIVKLIMVLCAMSAALERALRERRDIPRNSVMPPIP